MAEGLGLFSLAAPLLGGPSAGAVPERIAELVEEIESEARADREARGKAAARRAPCDLLAEPACVRLPPNLRPLLLETPGTSSALASV